jgi:DNA helicase-2/ATP-dependent DNA helicase PcrA
MKVGIEIVHKKFGIGHIVQIKPDRLVLQFGETTKELVTQTILDNGLIAKNLPLVQQGLIVK